MIEIFATMCFDCKTLASSCLHDLRRLIPHARFVGLVERVVDDHEVLAPRQLVLRLERRGLYMSI